MDPFVDVVVEVPRGSRNKYEVDRNGQVRFDRRLPGAFAFPADYGYIPGAVGSDGEPLDALLLVVEPTYPGIRVRARVVGVFWVITGHGREAKMICVPQGDPAYEGLRISPSSRITSWPRSGTSSTSTGTWTPTRACAATAATAPRWPWTPCARAAAPPADAVAARDPSLSEYWLKTQSRSTP